MQVSPNSIGAALHLGQRWVVRDSRSFVERELAEVAAQP